jgi:hypothetical protein
MIDAKSQPIASNTAPEVSLIIEERPSAPKFVNIHINNVPASIVDKLRVALMREINHNSTSITANEVLDTKPVTRELNKRSLRYPNFAKWLLCACNDPSLKFAERIEEESRHSGGKIVVEAIIRWSGDDKCYKDSKHEVMQALTTTVGPCKVNKINKRNVRLDLNAEESEKLWSRHYIHRARRMGKEVATTESKKYGKAIGYYDAKQLLTHICK